MMIIGKCLVHEEFGIVVVTAFHPVLAGECSFGPPKQEVGLNLKRMGHHGVSGTNTAAVISKYIRRTGLTEFLHGHLYAVEIMVRYGHHL